MKYLSILAIALFLAGCSKKNANPYWSQPAVTFQNDPPPPYGLSLFVDTAIYAFSPDQVAFYVGTFNNTDVSSVGLRQDAHSITFTATDSVRSFTMTMNLVDLIPGDYILDGRNGVYFFALSDLFSIQYVQE